MRAALPAGAALLLLTLLAGCRAASPPAPAAPPSPLRFRDAAPEMGITWVSGITEESPLNITRMVSGGAGWIDADGDEWPDLVLVGLKGARLYRNEQGRRFVDATPRSGLDRLSGELQGVAAGDWDGDGRTDLLVTRYDGATLLRNSGSGRFQDASSGSGIDLKGWCTSAAFADVNGDGRLDVYVGRYVRFEPGMPEYQQDGPARLALGPDAYDPLRGVLFLNLGGGKFRDATREAGLDGSHGKTLGVIFSDYDLDGDQDLYLANDQALGDFFVNDGRGRFRNVAAENGTAVSATGSRQAGMGADWGDYNGDGRMDLIVTTFYNEPKSLYRQEEGGIFTESGAAAGLLQSGLRWTAFGVAFADWNNDGQADLMLANGHVQDQLDLVDPDTGYRQRPQVFLNSGGYFQEVSAAAGPAFQQKVVGRALAVADYDRDGRQDAVIANFAGPPLLLHNESTAGRWVGIRLRDQAPNVAGIGATVMLKDGTRTQVRTLQTGRSYLSAFLPEAHFGLGAGTTPPTGEVRWPDGTVQPLPELTLDAVNTVERK